MQEKRACYEIKIVLKVILVTHVNEYDDDDDDDVWQDDSLSESFSALILILPEVVFMLTAASISGSSGWMGSLWSLFC